jgi:hypothetical protein
VVTRRTDQSESWLLQADGSGLDSPACRQRGYIVESLPANMRDMVRRMNRLYIFGVSGDSLQHGKSVAQACDDGFHTPCRRRRLEGIIHAVKIIVKNNFHDGDQLCAPGKKLPAMRKKPQDGRIVHIRTYPLPDMSIVATRHASSYAAHSTPRCASAPQKIKSNKIIRIKIEK